MQKSDRYRRTVTHTTKHHGAELELDPLRYAEPMKFVAENVSQSADLEAKDMSSRT